MKIKPSGLVEQMSGSIGNLTFQASNAGLIARSKPAAIGRVTQFRTQRRALLANAVNAWKQLPAAARDAWHTAAPEAHGWTATNLITPSSGYEYYISQHMLLTRMGQLPDRLPPTSVETRELRNISIVTSAAVPTFLMYFSPSPLTSGEILCVALTVYQSPFSSSSGCRGTISSTLGDSLSSPLDLVPYIGPYTGLLQAGIALGVNLQIYSVAAQQLSRPTLTRCTIAP